MLSRRGIRSQLGKKGCFKEKAFLILLFRHMKRSIAFESMFSRKSIDRSINRIQSSWNTLTMNTETLNHYVETFKQQIVDSGFIRDVSDYVASIEANEENVLALKDMARTVLKHLQRINEGELPSAMRQLLPASETPPFTEARFDLKIKTLLDDPEIQQVDFYEGLKDFLTKLRETVSANMEDVEHIDDFIRPYHAAHRKLLAKENKAIVSVILKDKKTTGELSEFSKTIAAWNRALPLYHQLVTRTSPATIEIIEVQNGSIDIVLHLDLHAAMGLVDIFKIGFKAYAAYLIHKKLLLPVVDGYFGNKRLLKLDEEKESVLLENIREAIAEKALQQHDNASKVGAKTDNPSKVIEQIANLVTAHIVRGNDLKVLALPVMPNPKDANKDEATLAELNEASMKAKNALKELPATSLVVLLERYGHSAPPDPDAVASTPEKETEENGAPVKKGKRKSEPRTALKGRPGKR